MRERLFGFARDTWRRRGFTRSRRWNSRSSKQSMLYTDDPQRGQLDLMEDLSSRNTNTVVAPYTLLSRPPSGVSVGGLHELPALHYHRATELSTNESPTSLRSFIGNSLPVDANIHSDQVSRHDHHAAVARSWMRSVDLCPTFQSVASSSTSSSISEGSRSELADTSLDSSRGESTVQLRLENTSASTSHKEQRLRAMLSLAVDTSAVQTSGLAISKQYNTDLPKETSCLTRITPEPLCESPASMLPSPPCSNLSVSRRFLPRSSSQSPPTTFSLDDNRTDLACVCDIALSSTNASASDPDDHLPEHYFHISDLSDRQHTTLVKDLDEMFRLHYEHSMKRLRHLRLGDLDGLERSSSTALDVALASIHGLMYGQGAFSPGAVLAILHMAYSISVLVHREKDMDNVHHELFLDAVQWSHIITPAQDRHTFLFAAQALWCPKPWLLYCPSHHIFPHPGANEGHATRLIFETPQSDESTLLRLLRNGAASRISLRYIDRECASYLIMQIANDDQVIDFASFRFGVRNWPDQNASRVQKPSPAFVECIKQHVFRPFMLDLSLQELRPILRQSEEALDRGLIYTLRDLQIYLEFEANVRLLRLARYLRSLMLFRSQRLAKSHKSNRVFLDRVGTQFNLISTMVDQRCMYRQCSGDNIPYVRGLLDHTHSSTATGLAERSGHGPVNNHYRWSADDVLPPPRPAVELGSSRSTSLPTLPTASEPPAEVFEVEGSPTPRSPRPSLRCPNCDFESTAASAKDRKGGLYRHQRRSCETTKIKQKIRCSFCPKEYSRCDALKKHISQFH